jgi:predicted permease
VIKRVQLFVLTTAALATAVGIALVSAAFAVYAVLTPLLGQAGAAAAVSAIAAGIVGIAALLMRMEAKEGSRRREPEPNLTDRLIQVARDRPLLAGGAALAAGLLALKNPQAAAGLVSAFLAGKAADRTDNRRR